MAGGTQCSPCRYPAALVLSFLHAPLRGAKATRHELLVVRSRRTAMEIGRLLTAMVTPFDDEGQVDYAQAKRLALALLDSGSDGVVVAGTTGEAPTISHDEKLRLFREVKDAIDGRGAVIAGTG